MAIRERHQSVHELGSRTADLGAVIQVDEQATDVRIEGSPIGPPQVQRIGDEVAGVSGRSEDQADLSAIDFQDPGWGEDGVGVHVVIGGTDGLGSASRAAAGERADFHFRLGIDRDPQRFGIGLCGRVGGSQVVEDGVGLRHFF